MSEINHDLKIDQIKDVGIFFMKKYRECNNEVRHKYRLYSGHHPCMFLLDEHIKYRREYKNKMNEIIKKYD